ncbi:MAG: NTP transferase domain-containing protein [Patescibacteria group bacterium]|nr:NTP transferase domain-containing protein [Patescibacteria group bacterium]
MAIEPLRVVILAGGLGKRMGLSLPKALVPLNNRPMISYLLDAVKASGVCGRPLVVSGQKAELLESAYGDQCDFVRQHEQLGTGHAVGCTEAMLRNVAESIMVLYCDMPTLKPETIARLFNAHQSACADLTMATVMAPDYLDWRSALFNYGRVIRDKHGDVCRIVEIKDADMEQQALQEVNPSYFVFRAEWLWNNIGQVQNDNAQGEYYLTDLLGLAFSQGRKIVSVPIEPVEAVGANSIDEFRQLAKLL